ncbi:hypothetical protein LOK49_LG08G01321 [Camellia lanceoleosa]|uniref:Uncharacterized protein n=1 Tax=Camellia lanceoleosa TaxID=1840588 RepID=A0ACC0GS31_9ERIC|nr:hypothetical protein LOK49_LG08G01321 [Camellia lanceoleosa]
MDFHSMKRKELQSLCKKHNIPANLTNLEMANDLTSLLQGKEKPIRRGQSCLKKVGDLASENDSDAVTRQLKKVRFSPENEMFEFVELEAEPVEMKRGARRKSIMRPEVKKQSFVVENKEIVENPIRTTRSRTQKFSNGGVIEVVLPIVEAKRTKRVVNSESLEVKESVSGDNLPPVVDLSDKLEENRVATKKSLRNREVQSKKSKEIDKDVKPYRETVENPVRTTRSRAQKLPDGGVIEVVLPIVETKRTKRAVKSGCTEVKDGVSGDILPPVVDSSDNLASDSTAVEENRVPTRRSSRNREVVSKKSKEVDEVVAISRKNQTQRNSKKRNVETTDEISENNALAADGGITQPENALRWSKRNVEKVEDYALLNQDLGKNEMVGRRRNTRCRTQLAENASAVESGTRTETEVEVHGKLEVVLQLEEPSRRPVRNGNRRQSVMPQIEKAGTDGAKLENKNRKLLRSSVMEGGSSSKNLEENDGGRGPRRSSRHEIVAISDEMDRTANNNGKIKPRKSRRDPILEEESVVEEPPRWSARNAAKTDTVALTVGTDITVGRKKQPSRSKLPNLEVESLAKGTSAVKEPPILDAQLSMPGIAESAIDRVLNDNTGKKRKKFSGTSLVKEVSAETSDFEETTALKMVNSVEIPASEPGKLQNDHEENEVLFSVSGSEVVEKVNNAVGVDKEKPLQDNISTVNEHDSASHSCKRSRDFDTNDLVEPKTAEDFNVFIDVGFPQATFGDDWIHCVAKPADNLDLGKDMERDEKPGTGKYIDSCCVVDQHGVDDDKAYAPKEQKLVEFENVNSFGESIRTDLDAEGLLDESIESRVSKENSETVCEEAGESVVDHSDSERVISSEEKDREIDEDEKSAVDAEGEEYASCCPRMLNIEAESLLSKHISAFKGPPVTDSVMTEPEVSEGAGNLASSSSKKVSEYTNIERKGSSEDSSLKMQHHSMGLRTKSPYLNEIRGLVMENLEGTLASNSLKLQSDSAEPEREIPDSESLAATEKENIVLVAGNRNFTEFQEVCGFAEPSTYERVCEGHSTGPDESEGAGEDCENDSKKPADISVLDDPSHGERITPNMVEKNNNKAESSVESGKLHEKVLVSDVVTAEVVSAKATNFQLTSGYCSKGTQLTPLIASEYQGNTNHVELKENSNYDTEFHYGILSAADTFASTAGDKICCQERIDEASPEMKNKSEGILSVERALHPVDEETDHESLEGNSLRKCSFLPILSELNGQLTEKKENTGSETNSLHNSEEIEEKITSKFTDGKMSLIISVERDTDPTEDTHVPINTPKSPLAVNNEIMSSSEHTSLKDVNESGREDGLKALFATPDNNTFSNNNEIMSSSEHASLKDVNESGREDGLKALFATPADNNTFSNEEANDHELCQTPSKSNLVMEDKSSEFTESTVNGGAAAEDAQTDVDSLFAASNGSRGSKENSKNVCEEAGYTLAPVITPKSSLVVNNEIMSSSECTPLKYDNESIQEDELKILFATPANNTNPNEEEACSHEIECDEVRMQEGSTFSNVKNERTNSGEPQEVVGLTENEDEKMACKENALPTFSEKVTDEGSDGNEEVEVAQELNKSASTALDNLANRKGDEDLVEILKNFEGAVLTKDTPALINTPKSSLVVNNEIMSSSECTPLKYDNESIQEDEFKILFATPANNTNPNEEEACSHEIECDEVRMQEGSTISNVKNERTNSGEPQEVVGLTENEDEKMACKENALPTFSEEVTDEGSDGNEEVEVAQELNKSASTALDNLANRKGDEDLVEILKIFEGAVLTKDTPALINTPKSSLVVNNEIMSSSECTPLKYDNESIQEDELKILFATPANNTNPNEEEACSHEIECDEVRMQEGSTISNVKNERTNSGEPQEVVGLTENEDEKMACKENALPTFSEEVTDEGSDGNEEVEVAQELNKSASTALDNLANRKGDEDLVEILKNFEGAVLTKDTPALINTPKSSLVVNNELMSSSECTPLKYDNESIQEDELKTMFATPANSTNPNKEEASSHETKMDDVRMQESSSFTNVNDMTNFGEPQEVELTENEDEKFLSTASEEVTDKGSDGNEDVEMVQELDKSASTASDKLADRKGDEDLVDISNKFEGVVPQVDGMNFSNLTGDKIELVQDLDKGAFLTSHEFGSAGHEHGEDLKERSSDVAGSKVQVEGMKLDDFDSNKDFEIMGGNLNIKDKDTDADKEVSPGYSNHYSEHEKVCLPLNVSDFDGNAPTSLDKSFPDNTDITKETIVDDMLDNVSSDATDGSNVEENVKSSQILSKEQLLGNEDAEEEDAFKGDISCLASNETNIIPEEADAMHWSFSNNFNDMVHCAVESNEYAEQQNISLASASTPEVNDDCSMCCGASELSLESNMFSSWEINMFLGDEGMKSTAGISETHFTCEDTVVASVKKENAEQLGKHSNLMEEKVVEINGSCFVSDESNYCRYSENKSVEVEKSSDSMHGVTLTDVYNNKGSEYAATVDLTVGGEFKCPREENIDNTVVEEAKALVEGHKCKEMVGEETELCEAVTKSNSTIEGQSFKLTVSAVDGETSAENAQLWQPNSEIVIVKNPLAKAEEGDFAVKHLNSTMTKMKNDRNKLIQETPKKRITALDMKENETAIKRDHVGSISVRSTAKRRALEDLRNK